MDLITNGLALLLIFFVVPALLATVSLNAYLSIACLGLVVCAGALWLVENLTLSEFQSRNQSKLGLV
ncbi:hypothetical protein N7467_006036 [Penicillium canescens]|nr:hypothetical protein N7467_006036 [Penicillium canescens]